MNNTIFNLMFTILPILVAFIFIITFLMIFNPKFRGKFQARQMKSLKYMLEDSKEDITDISTSAINIEKNILDKNENILKDIATKKANISSIGVEATAKAIKKGLTEENIYCKHCGKTIAPDSKYCKYCGKEQ